MLTLSAIESLDNFMDNYLVYVFTVIWLVQIALFVAFVVSGKLEYAFSDTDTIDEKNPLLLKEYRVWWKCQRSGGSSSSGGYLVEAFSKREACEKAYLLFKMNMGEAKFTTPVKFWI